MSDDLERARRALIARAGPWTAHNIDLGGGVFTMGKGLAGDEVKLRRIVQTVADIAGRPLAGLRVLDLACLEGMYAVELARHGATVVAIEGRAANIEKARFARDALGLADLDLIQDDVRHLTRAAHGEFDVVLCLGILYHLDAPDVFSLLARIAEVCRGFCVIDTHVSPRAEAAVTHAGRTYWGRRVSEHSAHASAADKLARLWASLDNADSFWPTRASLENALGDAGFTSVYECRLPPEVDKPVDRLTLVAMRGRVAPLLSAPLMSAQPVERVPEHARARLTPTQRPLAALRRLARLLPAPVRRAVRALVFRRR